MVYFPLQQSSKSCLPPPAIIRRSSIFWKWWHAIPCLVIFLHMMQEFIKRLKTLSTSTRQHSSNSYLDLFRAAEKSADSFRDLSKLSSTLQHLLTASEWAIASGESLVGSFVPSYRKAGCFRCWRGWIQRLTKEKTTWSPVTPLFLKLALDLFATGSCTWPVCLDLGGACNSFWKWRFKVPDMKPETFPLSSFIRWIIS